MFCYFIAVIIVVVVCGFLWYRKLSEEYYVIAKQVIVL